jgi:hypothetical protein
MDGVAEAKGAGISLTIITSEDPAEGRSIKYTALRMTRQALVIDGLTRRFVKITPTKETLWS